MEDLFGNKIVDQPVRINIYADEIQGKTCPYTRNEWNYIGLIIEKIDNSFFEDILHERYKGNYDQSSPYYEKNNKTVHWCDIRIADTKNVCKRWFDYIMNPSKSGGKLFSYILGINNSHIVKEEFDQENEFNSIYNRFFRSGILYAIKTFFPNQRVIIENVFHEVGQQKDHEYFPWHSIYILNKEEKIDFKCDRIQFLPKDHKIDSRSNVIQLCDCILGVSTCLMHGVEDSNSSKYRNELLELYYPLLDKMMSEPGNSNSRYGHHRRLLIRFFPIKKTGIGESGRLSNQFYYKRKLFYMEQRSGQGKLFET